MEYFSSWPGKLSGEPTDMRQFISFIRKEFHHIFRDRTTMAILLLLPVMMLLLFGYAITTEVKESRIAIIDPSQDAATRAMIEKFLHSEYFSVEEITAQVTDPEKFFRENRYKMVMIFSEHFQESMDHGGDAQVLLLADATDPNSAKSVVSYATNILSGSMRERAAGQNIPYQILPEVKLLYNPRMKGAYNFVPGVMGMILMLICAMMTSISIAREKETGTMEILLVSPVRPFYIILAKTVPYFVLSLMNLTTILLLSVFLLGVPVAGSLFALIILSLIYIFVNLSLGLVISSVVDTQLVALLLSGMVLMIPVIMLSGMIFPVENMPLIFQWISHIIPARWYIIAVKKIMIKGLGFHAILGEVAFLSLLALALVGVSIRKFKYRLE